MSDVVPPSSGIAAAPRATVGFRSGRTFDRSRPDWDGAGPRPIAWAAWYPADDDVPVAPMRPRGPGAPWFDLGPVARDAPFRRGAAKRPVAVLAHGTGGTALGVGWLGRRLAERGVVAFAVDHHGNTATESYRPEGFVCWWERARDLSFLLDAMHDDPTFAGRLDDTRGLAAGFSLGGHTALALLGGVTDMARFQTWAERRGGPLARGPREFPDLADRFSDLLAHRQPFRESWDRRDRCYRDPRLGAALLLAPAPPVRAFTDESLGRIDAPVLMLIGGADAEAPAEDGATWLAERIAGSAVEEVGPAVGHYAFLPEATEAGRREAPALCVDAPEVDRTAIHDAASSAAAALLARIPAMPPPSTGHL